MDHLHARCPAKINLGLEIIGRRPDGYHDLVTIFQAISRYDDLTVAPADDLTLTCSDPALATPDNLCLRAAAALQAATDTRQGALIHLRKGIPAAAGLGGGSSDAAATLRLLDRLWGTALPTAELARLAASLGADVPFFLNGPTAAASGIGDRLEPLPAPTRLWLVLVCPAVVIERKTARLYQALSASDFTDGQRTRAQATRLLTGQSLDPTLLVNSFARPLRSESPAVAETEAAMRAAGASVVFPAGSGPTLVALTENQSAAAKLAAACQTAGLAPICCHTLP